MTPIKLFQGYSSTTGACHSTAVTGESKIEGVQSEVTYTLCKGVKSLMTTIDVKQSLDINVKLGSINEKLKFLMKLNTTETTLAIVVHARKVEGREAQTSARLASDIVVPISDIRDFFFHHGDAYVSSITTGGEYIAVLSFHTETESERYILELELKGNGLFTFGSVNFGLQAKVNRVVESFKTKISFNQMILGHENSYELPKFEEIIEFARKFPSMKLSAPKILAFETTGYEHVVGVDNSFNPIASNNPTKEFVIPPLPSLSMGTPKIQYKIDYSQEFGTQDKTESKSTFDLFTSVDEYIKNKTRIVGIQLRTLSRLSNITVDFVSSMGRRTEIYGIEEGACSRLALEDQDFIKKIVVKSNRDVDGLGIYLDLNSNRWLFAKGDDDSDNGTEHTFELCDGKFVLGFRGFHSFKKFDTIQVIYAAFQPAKWRNGSTDVVNP
uniref:Jacalin-type lectin domain-containing protein n=1 Tax=Cannabis sativa TaxID=3483 RepID=A0A803Q9U7_CANSA